jgi:hypothetical protein
VALPGFREFVSPVLRHLARHTVPVAIADVYDGVADTLEIAAGDREVRLTSGGNSYESRVRWAFGWLNRAGLGHSPLPGQWELTSEGRELAATHEVLSDALFDKYDEKANPRSSAQNKNAGVRRFPAKNEGRKAYRLPPQPFARGGQSLVYEATRKADGKVFVMKRAIRDWGGTRMRREIEVQTALKHQHIMPIIDWDQTDYLWFVMPKGIRSMHVVSRPLDTKLILSILESITDALRFAHDAGHPHRDLKPENIIELAYGPDGPRRWVLADWGLTRRPLGETTSRRTRSGHLLGTEGFAPPEAYRDAHRVGPAGDIYSLGQVIAWAIGVEPIPNVSPVVSAPWTEVVARMTRQELGERPQTIADLQALLSSISPPGTGSPA